MDESRLVRLVSVRVRLHPTWYVAVALITGILVTQYSGAYALWERIVLGLAGSLLFMLSLAVVALASNVVAILSGIRVRNLTLFVFGGVAVVPEDGTGPGRELGVAIMNLVLNFGVAAMFNWLYVGVGSESDSILVPLLQSIAFLCYMLAILHVIPAFPLAGGKILMAAIWRSTRNYLQAIRISGRIGFLIGVAIGVFGLVQLLGTGGQTTNGLLLVFVGWALQGAAVVSMRRGALLHALQHTDAGSIMTKEFLLVSPEVTVGEIVRERILKTGLDYFAVSDGNRLLGIATDRNIAHLAKERWDSTPIGMVMTKPNRLVGVVSPGQLAGNMLEAMDQLRIVRMPVIQNGSMVGMVTREGILRLARLRTRLRV